MNLYRPFRKRDAFAAEVGTWRERYSAADPFPHIVLDGMINPIILKRVVAEVAPPEDEAALRRQDDTGLQERKHALDDPATFGAETLGMIGSLLSRPFLTMLSELTGIAGLVPDPYFRGGGFHQIARGGKLAVHADFNIHSIMKLRRRINLLLYLNEDWLPEWGGALELWSADMRDCRVRVLPIFNRMVIFSTTESSFHGHPDPLDCPEGILRRSLALYYYTLEGALDAPHSTLWMDRPQDGEAVKARLAEKAAARQAAWEVRRIARLNLRQCRGVISS